MALVVSLLVLDGLVVGAVGGVAAARLAGFPGSPVTAPAADVPRGSDGLFREVTGPGLEQAMQKASYTCSPGMFGGAGALDTDCSDRRTADYDISLSIDYRSDGRVTSLIGRCSPVSSTATVVGCGSFIGGIPALLYPANAPRARPAQDWVSQNLGADTSTVIDGIYYVLQLQPLVIVCSPAA